MTVLLKLKKQRLRNVLLLLPLIAFPVGSLATESAEPLKRTSAFNEQWLDTVVSIEQKLTPEKIRQIPLQEKQKIIEAGGYTPVGTGFVVQTEGKRMVLVTAGHVIQDGSTTQPLEGLGYRFNEQQGASKIFPDTDFEQRDLGRWFISATHDVACRFIGRSRTSRLVAIPHNMLLPQEQLQAGASLLILGFPLGLRSPEQTMPVARRGIIARSDPGSIIADAFIFPGNSGGPAIYVPVLKVGGSLESPWLNEERLVGVVTSYIPYREPAISPTIKRTRIIFEENTGLTNIVPVDALLELLRREDVRSFERDLPPR
jgi:hypothetical protein